MNSPDASPSTSVVVFDVNETLSDLSPMSSRFADVGAPGHLAPTWFSSVLRDGLAAATTGRLEKFADIARENLRVLLPADSLDRSLDDAVEHVMSGFLGLPVHPDVPSGVRALAEAGLRLVTLTNGSTSVADQLLGTAGLRDSFERLMSVEDAGLWKPGERAYRYAGEQCGTELAEMVLVAVHPWDIDGAARAGMRTAWVNRAGGHYPRFAATPDIEVASLEELAPALR